MKLITQERLKAVLSYDPDTGEFHRIWAYHNHLVGQLAGGVNVEGYVCIKIQRQTYKAHRLAVLYMTGELPLAEVDHINGIRTDNRWANLRQVSGLINHHNRQLPAHNRSSVMGVGWDKKHKAWRARINYELRCIHLGRFSTFDEAVMVRKAAEKRLGFHDNHGRQPCY